MLNKKIFALCLVIFLTNVNLVAANTENIIDVEISEPAISVNNNVVFAKYRTWPQAELTMDIFVPGDNEKHPAVIFIPGGAWLAAPKGAFYQMPFKLAENNFVTACIEYRLIGAADYTEIIGDAKAAVRYLRAHADEFNIDKNKIAVIGSSVGGYLATMLGVTSGIKKFDFGDNIDQSSEVQAVVDFFGPTDLTKIADDYSDESKKLYYSPSSFVSLFANGVSVYKNRKGGSILDNPETAKETNPLNYISKNTPPFLIFHGDNDETVSPSQSKILHDTLTENKINSALYIINGGGHSEIYFYQPKPLKIIIDFLNRVLK